MIFNLSENRASTGAISLIARSIVLLKTFYYNHFAEGISLHLVFEMHVLLSSGHLLLLLELKQLLESSLLPYPVINALRKRVGTTLLQQPILFRKIRGVQSHALEILMLRRKVSSFVGGRCFFSFCLKKGSFLWGLGPTFVLICLYRQKSVWIKSLSQTFKDSGFSLAHFVSISNLACYLGKHGLSLLFGFYPALALQKGLVLLSGKCTYWLH